MEIANSLFTAIFSLIVLGGLANEIIYKLSYNVIIKIISMVMIVSSATYFFSYANRMFNCNILFTILFWTSFILGMVLDRQIDNFIKKEK